MDKISDKQQRTKLIEAAKMHLTECESAVKACLLLQDYAWQTAQNPFMAWKIYASPAVKKMRVAVRQRWLKADEALTKLLKKPARA
jgi:hypothetical protein